MTKMPPVPPEQRSGKGPGVINRDVKEKRKEPAGVERNFEKQRPDQMGEQANIRQNTRNQGYHQDR
jgi:hypothetical protein